MGVVSYHIRTKHHPHRPARSPGYLDWRNQPNPFRFWEGTDRITLSFSEDCTDYTHLYVPKQGDPDPFSIESLGSFLHLALGLSAWKAVSGSRWAVRMNPSSGNLHPTECYLVVPSLQGVFHYNPYLHALEKRADLPEATSSRLRDHFGTEGFILILTSIPWREAWKYGERAYRYCLLDLGHAIGSVRFSANLRGWKMKYLNALSDEDLTRILGFNRIRWAEGEEEFPLAGFFVFPKDTGDVPRDIPPSLIEELGGLKFYGKPNILSRDRVIWEEVFRAAYLTRKPRTDTFRFSYGSKAFRLLAEPVFCAEETIKKRRSGTDYDGRTHVRKEIFLDSLMRTLPADNMAPFDVEISPTYVDLFIALHRVEGMERGLYLLLRNEDHMRKLKKAMRGNFLWERVDEDLPLYLMRRGDFRNLASYVSCYQAIAGDSAFSLFMLSLFEEVVSERPWEYRNMHFEAGLIGHVLYLEATSKGFSGTGIGCFFDDLVHEMLGAEDLSFQDIYHFTFGKAVEDPRIQTLDPYYHLKDHGAS